MRGHAPNTQPAPREIRITLRVENNHFSFLNYSTHTSEIYSETEGYAVVCQNVVHKYIYLHQLSGIISDMLFLGEDEAELLPPGVWRDEGADEAVRVGPRGLLIFGSQASRRVNAAHTTFMKNVIWPVAG
jgi:hypothetical protein